MWDLTLVISSYYFLNSPWKIFKSIIYYRYYLQFVLSIVRLQTRLQFVNSPEYTLSTLLYQQSIVQFVYIPDYSHYIYFRLKCNHISKYSLSIFHTKGFYIFHAIVFIYFRLQSNHSSEYSLSIHQTIVCLQFILYNHSPSYSLFFYHFFLEFGENRTIQYTQSQKK